MARPAAVIFAPEGSVTKRHKGRWPLMLGAGILIFLLALAVLAPVIATQSPTQTNGQAVLLQPSATHLMGTDSLGRDVYSRVLHGARYDLSIAFIAVGIAAVVGSVIGALLGYFGGALDTGAMRVLEIFQAFPSLILALLLVATFGSGYWIVVFVIAFINVPIYVRLVRAEVQVLRSMEYIQAARTLGLGPIRIIRRHIFPNATAPIIAYIPVNAVFSIIGAAGLGFLGLGVKAPTPEWGLMIASGTQDIIGGAWWTSVFPGMALVVASAAFFMLGEGLQNRSPR